MPKKILLVTQYFYPENFRSNDIAFEMKRKGYMVDVLTGIPNYPEGHYTKHYGIFSKRVETINGVNIFRSFQTPRGKNATKLGLSLNYFSFALCATMWAIIYFIFKRKYFAIFVFQTSPITQAIPAIILGKIKNIPVYTYVLDLWPNAISSHTNNKYIFNILNVITNSVYNNSRKILISSKGYEELIIKNWKQNNKIVYFPNWCDDMLIMHKTVIPELPKGFIIMMAGNIGEAQNIEEIIATINELKDIPEIKWAFLGEGSRKKELEDYVKTHNLTQNVFLYGRFPFESMPSFYAKASVMWISLKTDKVQLRAVIPLRLQSYMSAEKPIIGVGEGSIVQLVKDADCGFVASNAKELSSYLRTELLHNSNRLHKMGLNGRNYFEKNFEKNICINNLCEIINDK